jgi:hypothetical protein
VALVKTLGQLGHQRHQQALAVITQAAAVAQPSILAAHKAQAEQVAVVQDLRDQQVVMELPILVLAAVVMVVQQHQQVLAVQEL